MGAVGRLEAGRLAPASPALTPAGVTAASQNQLRYDDPLPASQRAVSDNAAEAVAARNNKRSHHSHLACKAAGS